MPVGTVISNHYVKRVSSVSTVVKNHTENVGDAITIAYQQAGAAHDPESTSHEPTSITLTLLESTDDQILPGSVLFEFGGVLYFDRNGIIYKDFDSKTGAGTAVGSIDYNARTVTLETWTPGASPGVTIHACATVASSVLVTAIAGRTPGAPLRSGSFQASVTDEDGNVISEIADQDGRLLSGSLSGVINYETGVYDLWYTTDPDDDTGASDIHVSADSGLYNAVLYTFLPLDAELIGLDPVRLPSDGRVPIVREGDVLVLSHTAETDIGTPTDGQQVSLARDHQAHIEVVDANGVKMEQAQYTANKLAGTVTFATPVLLQDADTSPLTTPLTIRDRIEHMSVVSKTQITGQISFNNPLAHDFPAQETVVSTALKWGDINSRVFNFFTQKVWNSGDPNWGPDRIGDDTTANYDIVNHPIEYDNRGSVTEEWAYVFTSSTGGYIAAEQRGVIGTFNTSVDSAPINPNTGTPFHVVRASGWGSGWASGNVMRFGQEGCLGPGWIARTVLAGQAEQDDDEFVLQVRGDAD